MSAIREQTWTVEKYLAFERESEEKHEFLDGRVYAMSGASREHNLITLRTAGSIDSQLGQRPCETYANDMRVRVSPTVYFYPDVVVVCDTPQFEDGHRDTLLNPTVVIEVLSPSTESFDRGKKFHNYRTLESLQEYVLISQDSYLIERFTRQENGLWLLAEATGIDATLELTSIQCVLRLADIYRQITFAEGEA